MPTATDDVLEIAKNAFKNRKKNRVNIVANKIKKSYKNMTKEQIKEFESFIKNEFSPSKITEDGINNIQSLYNNKKLLQEVSNPNLNPLAIKEVDKLNSGLMSSVKDNIRKEISEGEKYFDEIKNLLLNDNKEIKDFGLYGSIVDVLEGDELDDATKTLLRKQVGINKGVKLENDLSIKHKEDFIAKTFKGDAKNESDVAEYLTKIDGYLGIGGKDSEMYQEMKNIVSDRGNLLKAQEAYEKKVIEKQRKRAEKTKNKSNNDSKTSKSTKEIKASKKIEKREMKDLRAATGTEGGTLVDFFKGSKGNLLNVGLSTIGAVAEYKEGRNEGKTVLGSAADAAVSFVAGEVLGWTGMLTIGAVKGVTTLGLKGAKYAIDSSRSMNNIQRFTPFADAQFQDTQQLATMRQSGMELAKMSQYNLQQTLMGTEARHLHR